MKAVILAGGLGSRLSEETESKPKPMVEVGGRPILWHIMKIYSHYGINDFIVCLAWAWKLQSPAATMAGACAMCPTSVAPGASLA